MLHNSPLLDDVVEKLFETHFGMGRNTWMSHLQTTTKGADQVNVPNGKEPPPGKAIFIPQMSRNQGDILTALGQRRFRVRRARIPGRPNPSD